MRTTQALHSNEVVGAVFSIRAPIASSGVAIEDGQMIRKATEYAEIVQNRGEVSAPQPLAGYNMWASDAGPLNQHG